VARACGGALAMHYRVSSIARGRGLHKRHILLQVSRHKRHAHPAFKPTTHHTSAPSTHSLSHTQCAATRCATCTATVVTHSPCIPTATAFMILAVPRPVLALLRLTVTGQDLPLPVHDHGRCTAIFCPCDSGTNPTPHRRGANLCAGARTCGVYSRVVLRLHVLKKFPIPSDHPWKKCLYCICRVQAMSTFNDELDGRQKQIALTAFFLSGICSGRNHN
jgi:hypothetical protein